MCHLRGLDDCRLFPCFLPCLDQRYFTNLSEGCSSAKLNLVGLLRMSAVPAVNTVCPCFLWSNLSVFRQQERTQTCCLLVVSAAVPSVYSRTFLFAARSSQPAVFFLSLMCQLFVRVPSVMCLLFISCFRRRRRTRLVKDEWWQSGRAAPPAWALSRSVPSSPETA